jgi:hypothetical protein
MGQQHRVRAKRKRRQAYWERRKTKEKTVLPQTPRAKTKKATNAVAVAVAVE